MKLKHNFKALNDWVYKEHILWQAFGTARGTSMNIQRESINVFQVVKPYSGNMSNNSYCVSYHYTINKEKKPIHSTLDIPITVYNTLLKKERDNKLKKLLNEV
jgi:hypothetical protein